MARMLNLLIIRTHFASFVLIGSFCEGQNSARSQSFAMLADVKPAQSFELAHQRG